MAIVALGKEGMMKGSPGRLLKAGFTFPKIMLPHKLNTINMFD
jgi:hypothetical protein